MREFAITGMAFSMFFAIAETWYFGWNLTPQSSSEYVADAVAIAICAISITVYSVSK